MTITAVPQYAEIVTNVVGRVRRETRGGRVFLVAPAVSIVPGVLNGSKGALYYTPEEISRNHAEWDGVPLVVYHPIDDNGLHVSARDPGVIERQGVGHLHKTRILNGGRLGHEVWFDEEKLTRADNALPDHVRILPRLLAGKPIELSTGLFTDNEEAPPNSQHNGRGYTHIARNYRPDHLAILPDQVGACSVYDGCGVLVNRGGLTGRSGLSANAWSDEARAAAALARGHALAASTAADAGAPKGAGHTSLSDAARRNSFRAERKTEDALSGAGTHGAALLSHQSAAGQHNAAGRNAEARGDQPTADSHYLAVLQHARAADFHGRQLATSNVGGGLQDGDTGHEEDGQDGHDQEECHCGGTCGKCHTTNMFCPTGQGGGVDPSCSTGGSGSGGKPSSDKSIDLLNRFLEAHGDLEGLNTGSRHAEVSDLADQFSKSLDGLTTKQLGDVADAAFKSAGGRRLVSGMNKAAAVKRIRDFTERLGTSYTQLVGIGSTRNAWSDAAREAAAEARKQAMTAARAGSGSAKGDPRPSIGDMARKATFRAERATEEAGRAKDPSMQQRAAGLHDEAAYLHERAASVTPHLPNARAAHLAAADAHHRAVTEHTQSVNADTGDPQCPT